MVEVGEGFVAAKVECGFRRKSTAERPNRKRECSRVLLGCLVVFKSGGKAASLTSLHWGKVNGPILTRERCPE